MIRTRSRLRHPIVEAIAGLAFGALLVALLLMWQPWPATVSVTLPVVVASKLSAVGDRAAVFARPEALWLMPAAVIPFLALVVRRSLVDLRPAQVVVQLVTRLAVLMAVATALAQPSLRSPIRAKTVVFAIDVSDSIDDAQLEFARAAVQKGLERLREEAALGVEAEDRTRLAVLTYAATTRVRPLKPDTDASDLVTRHDDGGLASDHGGALRLAAALVDPQTEGRVVLISDGGGAIAEREDLANAAAELQSQGLALHV